MRVASISLTLGILLLLGTTSNAAESLSRAQLTSLLDTGWKASGPSWKAAQEEYGVLLRAAPGDTNLDYAYLLVMLRQRKYDEALDQSAKVLTALPGHLPALQARVYTLTLLKKYEAALVEMETMAKALVKPRTPALTVDEARDYAKFLGRVYAYINGPAQTSLTEQSRETAHQRIVTALGKNGEGFFREGLIAVATKYAALQQGLTVTRTETIAAEDQAKEQAKVQLAEQKNQIAAEAQTLDEKLSKLRADAEGQLKKVDAQITPLQQQITLLDTRAANEQSNIVTAEANIATWINVANNAGSPAELDNANIQINFHRNQRAIFINKLNTILAQRNGVANQLAGLQATRQTVVNTFNSQNDAIERRFKELGGLNNRVLNDEKKAAQPSSGLTTQTMSLNNKLTGFSTYEDFPFELQRTQLLDGLK
jgi:HD-GYP domain-containing protein (c-di-GMP phosphodiesterase class II)